MQQQWATSWSDCDVQEKVDFLWQPAMTSSVVGPRRSSKAFPTVKIAPKQDHGHCLVVCCPSNPLQLSEFWKYITFKKYAQKIWDPLKTSTPAASSGQQKGAKSQNNTPNTQRNQCFKSGMNSATKLCLIDHIHLTSCQQTTTSSSILTTFCRENAFTINRMQKMLS